MGLGAFDRREHHREALEVVTARRFGLRAGVEPVEEFPDHAHMAQRLVLVRGRGDRDRLERAREALVTGDDMGFEGRLAVPCLLYTSDAADE